MNTYDDHVLALELFLGRLQQRDEGLPRALRQDVGRQRDVERLSPQDGVPGLTGSAES